MTSTSIRFIDLSNLDTSIESVGNIKNELRLLWHRCSLKCLTAGGILAAYFLPTSEK